MKHDKMIAIFRSLTEWGGKLLMVILTAALIVLIIPHETAFKYEFQEGGYWKHADFYAPFEFALAKSPAELKAEESLIRKNSKAFFTLQNDRKTHSYRLLTEQLDTFFLQHPSLSSPHKTFLTQRATNILTNLYTHGIINLPFEMHLQPESIIMVVEDGIAQEKETGNFYTISQSESYIAEQLRSLPLSDRSGLKPILKRCVFENVIYSEEKTEQMIAARIADIPPTRGKINKGQLLIEKGSLIVPETYQVLHSFRKEYDQRLSPKASLHAVVIGQFLLVFISLCVLFLFLYTIKSDALLYGRKMLFILFVIFGMVGMVVAIQNYNSVYLYVAPLCLAPFLIRTFFETRLVLYIYLVTIVIIGFLVPNSFEFVFYQLIVGMMTIISIEKLESRSGFLKTSVIIFSSYSIIYIALTLIQDAQLDKLEPIRFVYFGANAILTLLSMPLIYVLERLFGFTSAISLLEYSNMNNKIMRELSGKAPGTFQHSVQVANISEDIIHAIGGNALLTRVGALHHDIGKIAMPMFFIENQNTNVNPHDEISNIESARIITAHVSDGISIAHRYRLPEDIIDFIRTHHGTTKTRYFYAMEQKQHPEDIIDEKAFSYKGIKPFSKETAVVMMVDAVEAASRSLSKHSQKEINDLVEHIINGQIADGQFANANITFKDIEQIKRLLKKELQSIYHVRIEYPVDTETFA